MRDRRRRACFVLHGYYDEDARARRQAKTLLAAGWQVDAVALRRPGGPPVSIIDGVRVTQLPVARHQGTSAASYAAEYVAFTGAALIAVTRAHRSQRYALIQVSNLPDLLAASAIPTRMVGVPLLLDLKEAMPEFFAERFARLAGGGVLAALRWQERMAVALASHVITVNHALADRLVQRGVDPDTVDVIVNSHDPAVFDPAAHPQRSFREDGVLRLVYAGALTPLYEVEVGIRAIGALRDRAPELRVELDILGRGDRHADLVRLVDELALGGAVRFHGRQPLDTVPRAVARVDVCLALTRLSPYTRLSLSTKLFEYAAMRRPIVATRLPMVDRAFGDTVLTYVSGDVDGLVAQLLHLMDDPAGRERRVDAAAARANEMSWDIQGKRYREIVESLATS
jgi:glycosyltransferase involved in cell wall biosynthesis